MCFNLTGKVSVKVQMSQLPDGKLSYQSCAFRTTVSGEILHLEREILKHKNTQSTKRSEGAALWISRSHITKPPTKDDNTEMTCILPSDG